MCVCAYLRVCVCVSRYCFKRLLRDKRTGDLLELPRRFWKDLSHWLQQQPGCAELLWILLGQMGEYKTATQAIELDAETKNVSSTHTHTHTHTQTDRHTRVDTGTHREGHTCTQLPL